MSTDDESLAALISAVSKQYRDQINDPDVPVAQTRLEIIRKLELIRQSIKGLMKFQQQEIR